MTGAVAGAAAMTTTTAGLAAGAAMTTIGPLVAGAAMMTADLHATAVGSVIQRVILRPRGAAGRSARRTARAVGLLHVHAMMTGTTVVRGAAIRAAGLETRAAIQRHQDVGGTNAKSPALVVAPPRDPMTTGMVGAVADQRVAGAETKADGLGTPKVTPRRRAAGGRTETMAIAAGSGILKATPRRRGAGGRTETMATAAGSAIQRDIRKPRAVAGKSVGRLLAPTGATIADPHVPAVGMTTMIGGAAAAVHKADSQTRTRAC